MLATWAHYATRRRFRRLATALSHLATALHPHDPDVWLVRAGAHGTFGQTEAAAAVLRTAIRKIPSSIELKTELAHRLIGQGKTAEARRILNELPDDGRSSPGALSALAHAAWAEGASAAARDLALETRRRLADLPADQAGILGGIGYLLADIPGAEEDAVETLKIAAETAPDDPRPHMLLAALLAGKDDQAASRHAVKARRTWGGGRRSLDAEIEAMRDRVRRHR